MNTCPACGGFGEEMGPLGNATHYRCRNCGWWWRYNPCGTCNGHGGYWAETAASAAKYTADDFRWYECPECKAAGRPTDPPNYTEDD